MKIKKISFNAKGSFKEASYRIPFIWIRSYLEKKYICVDNQIDNSVDLYFCKAGQGIAKEIRKKVPSSKIVLFKPHLEEGLHFAISQPIKTLKSIVNLLLKSIFRNQFRKYKEDISSSDILIADSRKLKLFYESTTNKKTYYLKLLEKINKKNIKPKKGLNNKDKITFLYFGSVTHYNESYPELFQILNFISKTKKVEFICLTRLIDIKKLINIKNINALYYEYDFKLLLEYIEQADIGYAPNFLRPRFPFLKKIHDYFNHLLYQFNLYSITEKNSSNAGRSYLFSQFGVPFIAHPTREVVVDFSDILILDFPNNFKEAIWIVNRYLKDNSYYENISKQLLNKSIKFDLNNEVLNLIDFLEKI